MNIQEPAAINNEAVKKLNPQNLQFMKKRKFWIAIAAIHLLVVIPAVVYLLWKRPAPGERELAKYYQELPKLKQQVEKDPENYQLRNEYAYTLYVTRNDDEAIAQYQTLSQKNPSDPIPTNNLGNLQRKRGNYEEAIASYQRSIEANPNQVNAYVNLAHLYIYDIRQPELGYETLNKVIALNPENTDLKVMLAKTYQQQDNDEKAIEVFTNILEVDPNNVAAQNGMKVLGASISSE